MSRPAISLRELAFVRDVLIPRAWVQGAEVDELLRLRAKIDGIFAAIREEQVAAGKEPPSVEPPSSPERVKKPRHPKKGQNQVPARSG